MAYYNDLREYVSALDKNGKLVRIKKKINKDTELHPLVRWQFRGLPDKERKAFLFESVTDAKGGSYNGSVLAASHAASIEVYALAMMCRPEEIAAKWEQAQLHPLKPRLVVTGPVHDEIHRGDNLLEHGGLDEFPIPISTPGFDNAPYITAGNWVSKDPETGICNVGNYRAMVKSQTRTGCSGADKHLGRHLQRYKEKGLSAMPVAVFIGPAPVIGLVSATGLPYGIDEYAVAGGIAGMPMELVKCQTADLEIPATAEIVIEGEIPTNLMERDGPFGEDTGYMSVGRPKLIFNITCITHRKQPIWNVFFSQFPPSEGSLLVRLGLEGTYSKFLKHDLSLPNLVDIGLHNESGGRQIVVISLKKPTKPEAWKALNGAAALQSTHGKIIIVVDDDINPRDMDSVMWALCYRMQPHRDLRVTLGKRTPLDPSVEPPGGFKGQGKRKRSTAASSTIMIDATRKWDYPPVSLPKREFMERAKQIWEEEGLPRLAPKVPWYGYSLGYWSEEDAEESELALQGEHYRTGEKLMRSRIHEE